MTCEKEEEERKTDACIRHVRLFIRYLRLVSEIVHFKYYGAIVIVRTVK